MTHYQVDVSYFHLPEELRKTTIRITGLLARIQIEDF
jgi:hypothetical protein